MPEGQEPTDTPAAGAEPNGTPSEGTEPKVFDEKYVKQLREEAAGNRTKVRDLEARLEEIEGANKSDLEKLVSERDKLRPENDTLKVQNLRLQVALDKKLPAELVDRLQGASKEEIEADADALLKLVRPPVEPEDLDGGARRPATSKGGMNDVIRRAAGRA